VQVVAFAQEFINSNYLDIQTLSKTLLGEMLIGTHVESGRVNCIKKCMKDIQKTLSDHIGENPQTEIETMKAVCTHNHPYLVQLVDAIEDPKLYVAILEYVSGGDMYSYLEKLGHGLPQEKALKYYRQLVEAVAFIHNKGYCHLDISAENILIDEANDCIKLCDFGLSRSFLPDNKPFPASNIRPGKIGYAAPEILNYQPFNGDKADSFSLGVMLFMFLTGRAPFKMASLKDPNFRYLSAGQINFLLHEWKMQNVIPPEAKDLLCKLFTKSEKRFSVNEILSHPLLKVHGK